MKGVKQERGMRDQNGELVVVRLWIVAKDRLLSRDSLNKQKTIAAIIRICCVYSWIARYRPMEIK